MTVKSDDRAMRACISILPALALAAGLVLAAPVAADIYKYVDKHGRVILTDKPANDKYKRLVRTWKGWEEQRSSIAIQDFARNKEKFTSTIDHYAEQYRLPKSLLHAVITAESLYDPDATSRTGAVGLMQLMPGTARRYGVQNRRNPSENIIGGSRYLVDLLRMFDNNLTLALAAYNAGENAVKEYGNRIPPYKETQNYVRKVIQYYKNYRETMPL